MKYFIIIKDKSIRVENKNFRILGDKPLYKWLVDQLDDEETYINTDSDRVEGGFHIIKRKQKHIDWENNLPTSPVLDMISDFLNEYVEDENEIIVTPHVTSPFLLKSTMIDASKKIGEYESVVSCTTHYEFSYLKKDDKIIPINFDPKHVIRTQDLDPIVFQNGAFFILTKKSFMKHQNRVGKKVFYYNLSALESIEIDCEDDYSLANLAAKGLGK